MLVANVSVQQIQAAMQSLVGKVSSANALTDLTLTDIKKLEITNAPDVQQHFVMLSTQEHQVTLQEDTAKSVTTPIIMRRLSARIDAKIGSGTQNDGLTIQKITVKNSQQQSYLYEKAGGNNHLDAGKTDKDYTISTSQRGYSVYTYENSQTADTHLEVTFALNGNTLEPIEVDFAGKAIERNHIYKVTFNRDANDVTDPSNPNQNAPKITFKIDVEDWNVSTSYVEGYADTSAPVIHSVTQKTSNWVDNVTPSTITLNPDNTQVGVSKEANYLAVEVHSKSTQTEAVITSGDTWVTVIDVTTYAGMQQDYQVEVKENTGAERKATIEFRNKLDASQKIVMTITQAPARPKLALEYVAEYNLTPNGTDFIDTHEYANDQQGYFTWQQAIQHGNAMSGYHLPTKEELQGIFSGGTLNYAYIDFENTRDHNDIGESITIDGTTQDYTADYRNMGNGTSYAIKMKDYFGNGYTQHTTAYRYRLEGTDGGNDFRLIVEAVYLGPTSSETINTVANPTFWTTHSSEVVSREFWAAGLEGSSYRGYEGYFWSASQYDSYDANPWIAGFVGYAAGVIPFLPQNYSISVRLFEGDDTTPLSYTAPTVTNVTQKQSNWTTDANPVTMTAQNNNTEIEIKNTANYLVLEVTGDKAHSTATVNPSVSWVTANNAVTDRYYNKFRVEVQPNPTISARTATIEITNNADPTKKVEVTITQAAATAIPKLALEYVAEYNLDPTGRAFTTTHEYANDQQGYFTWVDAVTHGNAMSGYHLPTEKEWMGIFPFYHHGVEVSFYYAQTYIDVDEEITIGGVTKTYQADYTSDGNGTAYAIKMKGHGDTQCTAYRYRLEDSSGGDNFHMIVEAIYLGASGSTNINNVASLNWASPDVTREFWAAGYNEGSIKSRGSHGYFWSATPYGSSSAWCVYFDSYHAYLSDDNGQWLRLSVRLFAD